MVTKRRFEIGKCQKEKRVVGKKVEACQTEK